MKAHSTAVFHSPNSITLPSHSHLPSFLPPFPLFSLPSKSKTHSSARQRKEAMAANKTRPPLFLIFLLLLGSFNSTPTSATGGEGMMSSVASEEWPIAMSIYGGGGGGGGDLDSEDGASADWDGEAEEEEGSSSSNRRSLFWRRWPYYISYGALSANRIPCPARSGRSYYTHNCYKARTPVNPYSRGCSRITRCRA